MTMIKPMSRNSQHRWLLCLSLTIALSVFHTANSAEKTAVKASKSPTTVGKVAVKSPETKSEVKSYTIIGYSDDAPAAGNKPPISAKAIRPQYAARRFGPLGRLNGRPWNPVMRFGGGPGAASGHAGRFPARPNPSPAPPQP